jgi:hypothetical protein
MTRRLAALLSLALLLSAAAFGQAPAAATADAAPDQQLWDATRRGDAAAVRAAIARGANVNAKWRYDQTPLFKAAERGDAEIVRILLEHKADPNLRDTFYGATPLTWALDKGHTEVVRALVDSGSKGTEDVLVAGARAGNTELVRMVLAKGNVPAPLLTRVLTVATIRHGAEKDEALKARRAEIVSMLKGAGAQPPFQVDAAVLKSYEGSYKAESGQGQELKVFVNPEGYLTVAAGNNFVVIPSDKVTFQPAEFEGLQLTFNVEGERVTGFSLKQGQNPPQIYKRLDK